MNSQTQLLPTEKFQEALTNREEEVALLAALGFKNKDIALSLGIKPKTVANHLHNIFTKLDIQNRDELITFFTSTQFSTCFYKRWISDNREIMEQLNLITDEALLTIKLTH